MINGADFSAADASLAYIKKSIRQTSGSTIDRIAFQFAGRKAEDIDRAISAFSHRLEREFSRQPKQPTPEFKAAFISAAAELVRDKVAAIVETKGTA